MGVLDFTKRFEALKHVGHIDQQKGSELCNWSPLGHLHLHYDEFIY